MININWSIFKHVDNFKEYIDLLRDLDKLGFDCKGKHLDWLEYETQTGIMVSSDHTVSIMPINSLKKKFLFECKIIEWE